MLIRSRPFLHLALIICLLGLVRPAQAAGGTYYVAINGSDSSGNGSASQPWASLSYAIKHIPEGSLVLVRPGTYNGLVQLQGNFAQGVTLQSETPYQARLRNNGQAVSIYGNASGITLAGFDIAHSGPGAGPLVIHINGARQVGMLHDITLRNNVLHDSYNSDILKIDASASRVTVEDNIFYNQNGSDEHIDVNSAQDIVIQHNIFFNDFAGSGRPADNSTSNYIVIKDSAGTDDQLLGSHNITLRGNVFLNWQGLSSSSFVMVGEDGKPYFEAVNVLLENNLMLGNSPNNQRAPLSVWGSKDVTFRNNTVSGDLPSLAYAMLLSKALSNPANENIRFYNNIWSDPTGTLGAMSGKTNNDFSDTPPNNTSSFTIDHNVYWNGGKAIPSDPADKINYTNDAHRVVGNPGLGSQGAVALPRWDPAQGKFGDGSSSVTQAFERLVKTYGAISANSAAVGAADPANAPASDILGRARGARVDAGAYQSLPTLVVSGQGGNATARLSWQWNTDLPAGTTWNISYASLSGSNLNAVTGLPLETRTYQFDHLKNHAVYAFTVSAVAQGGETLYSSTARVLITDIFVFLPQLSR